MHFLVGDNIVYIQATNCYWLYEKATDRPVSQQHDRMKAAGLGDSKNTNGCQRMNEQAGPRGLFRAVKLMIMYVHSSMASVWRPEENL